MLVGATGAAQLAWYDRTAIDVSIGLSANFTEQIDTEEVAYTVPAGKRAMIGLCSTHVRNNSVMGSASRSMVKIFVTPSGGAAAMLIGASLGETAQGPRESSSANGGIVLAAGDKIAVNIAVGSTVGNIYAAAGIAITEFDV